MKKIIFLFIFLLIANLFAGNEFNASNMKKVASDSKVMNEIVNDVSKAANSGDYKLKRKGKLSQGIIDYLKNQGFTYKEEGENSVISWE